MTDETPRDSFPRPIGGGVDPLPHDRLEPAQPRRCRCAVCRHHDVAVADAADRVKGGSD